MFRRQTLAFYTALLLLMSSVSLPGGPLLVCRMSGAVMAPVVVNTGDPPQRRSCCDVDRVTIGGASVYKLVSPVCCELRQSIERANPPAITSAASEMLVAILAAVPDVAPVPYSTEPILIPIVFSTGGSRAPPLTSSSPRAPPFFS